MEVPKKDILQKCLDYFFLHGIRGMPNAKLVQLLGISTKTIYKHFQDKENLLSEVLNLFYDKQYEKAKELTKLENPIVVFYNIWYFGFERLYKVNSLFFKDLHKYYPELEKKIEAKNKGKFWKEFIKVLEKGINEGEIRQEINPKVVMQGLDLLLLGLTRNNEYKNIENNDRELFDNTFLPFLRGLCTSKGLETLEEQTKKKL